MLSIIYSTFTAGPSSSSVAMMLCHEPSRKAATAVENEKLPSPKKKQLPNESEKKCDVFRKFVIDRDKTLIIGNHESSFFYIFDSQNMCVVITLKS